VSRPKAVVLTALIIISVAVVLLVNLTTRNLQVVIYKNKDMEPTISANERVIISRSVGKIGRGDIVIFRYPGDQSQQFIKRVGGLPGESIELRDGRLFVDQKLLEESYLDAKLATSRRRVAEYRIPPRSYYVLGDNRDASNDLATGALSQKISSMAGSCLNNEILISASRDSNSLYFCGKDVRSVKRT